MRESQYMLWIACICLSFLFYLAYFQDLSTLQHVSEFPSLLRLNKYSSVCRWAFSVSTFQGLIVGVLRSVPSLILELVEAFALKLPHLSWVSLLFTAPVSPHSRYLGFIYLLMVLEILLAQQCIKIVVIYPGSSVIWMSTPQATYSILLPDIVSIQFSSFKYR